uniref:hypothetical protein n=1 Tax=Paractinoplanes polyasparticus TaxID=2856853 RepID=UPI001C842E16|nr:hypothetical protein [Actinoplanes polyasparticus]
MTKARIERFTEDAASAFGFVVEEFGFSGPDTAAEGYVGYSSGPWQVWIVLEDRNKTVDTFVWLDRDGRKRHDSVWQLIAKAKLEGAGQSRTSALSRPGVQKSLAAQASALRLLIPRLLTGGNHLLD